MESKHAKTENDSYDNWFWNFDVGKVTNAYHAFVNQPLLKNKGLGLCFHNDKRKAKAKIKGPLTKNRNFT